MSYNSKYKGAEIDAKLDTIGKTPVVEHGTNDTTFELTPNVIHKWDVVSSLALTMPLDEEGFVEKYRVIFTAASASFSLALPYYCRWENDSYPSFLANMQYEIRIEGDLVTWAKFDKGMTFGVIEYAESDGSDYVLTDILLSDAVYGMRCKSAPKFGMGGSSSVAVAGTRQGTSTANTAFVMWYRQAEQGRRAYWNGATITFSSYEQGVAYTDEITNKRLTIASSYPLAVFAMNNAGEVGYHSKIKFYFLQLLGADDEPIVDLRPYRRKADGHVGLIDTITGKFYPSAKGNLTGA